jgi:hypothetical protein
MARILALLFVCALVACSTISSGWSSPSCKIDVPPDSAGVGVSHTQIFKVFPRRQDIGPSFTGCQMIWSYAPRSTTDIQERARILVIKGNPVAIESADGRCEYEKGRLTQASSSTCNRVPPELLPSMPAACAKTLNDKQCEYDLP